MSFEADQIQQEKADPIEGTASKFNVVPLTMLVSFLIFGISYLSIQTDKISFTEGDSRTTPTASSSTLSSAERGQQIYQSTCQACHQPSGTGIGTTFPPLDGSEWVNGDPETLCAIILHGINGEIEVKGKKFTGVMPTFKEQLKPEDIAAVATFIRSSWSNKSPEIDVSMVEKIYQATSSHSTPWKGGAELKTAPWK